MPNNPTTAVRNRPNADGGADPRVARTTHALGRALLELMRERPFDAITVQQILDRAEVGRTAFYTHFRNKEDVLHTSFERLFGALEPMLDRHSPLGRRLFPVTEFLSHIADEQDTVRALRRDGRMDDVWSLCGDHAARLIERRRTDDQRRTPQRQLRARMLAGALVAMMAWWLDHPDETTPAELDAAFHEFARGARAPGSGGA